MKKILTVLMTGIFISPLAFADNTGTPYKGDIASQPAVAPVAEESPLTGTFDITSNYVFRGISQTDNLPAVQGGLTYTFQHTGAYLNVWGSNTNFETTEGAIATVEFDTIAGISNNITDNLSYDVNYAYYNYPKASEASYGELNAKLTYCFLTGTLGYSNDVWGSQHTGVYYNVGANYDIPPAYLFNWQDVSISAGVGRYDLPKEAGNSYDDYSIALNKTIGKYDLTLQWTGTNGEANLPPTDDDHIVATVTANF